MIGATSTPRYKVLEYTSYGRDHLVLSGSGGVRVSGISIASVTNVTFKIREVN